MNRLHLLVIIVFMPSIIFAANGNLLLFLDEHFNNGDRGAKGYIVDPIATELASAIKNEVGVILVSPRVFAEYIGRAHLFHEQAQSTIHAAFTLMGALDGRGLNGKTLSEAMNTFDDANNQMLNAHIYSTYSSLRNKWSAKLFEDENIIILYPHSYLRERRNASKLLSRTELMSYTEEELLLGMQVKKSFNIELPVISDAKMNKLVSDTSRWAIHHKSVARSIKKLFIPKQAYSTENALPQWVIYLTGHGLHENFWDNTLIGGIEKQNFKQLLHDIDTQLQVVCLLYSTCYGGGTHTSPVFKEQVTSQKTLFDVSFPIIIASITDSTTRSRLVQFVVQDNTLFFQYKTNLKKFFETLHKEPKAFEDAVSYILEINKTDDDRHGISMLPLILIPRTDKFQPLSLSRSQKKALSNVRTFHLSRSLLIAHEMDKTPISIVNKSTILIIPPYVSIPLHIGEYAGKNADRVPVFISTNDSRHIHFLEEIKTNSSYIAENFHLLFFNFDKIKTKKVFVCRKIEFSQKGFALLMSKLNLPVSETNHPVIHDVISIQHEERVDIMFSVTIDGRKKSFIITPQSATDTSPSVRKGNIVEHRKSIEKFEATAKKVEQAARDGEKIEDDEEASWLSSVWAYLFGSSAAQ